MAAAMDSRLYPGLDHDALALWIKSRPDLSRNTRGKCPFIPEMILDPKGREIMHLLYETNEQYDFFRLSRKDSF